MNNYNEGYAKGCEDTLNGANIEYTYHVHTDDCYIYHPAITGTYRDVGVVSSWADGALVQGTCSTCGYTNKSYTDGSAEDNNHWVEKLKKSTHTCQAAYTEKVCGKNEDTIESVNITF